MRCDQLAALANEHLSDRYTFSVLSAPKPGQKVQQRRFVRALDGAIVFFLKNVAAALSPVTIEGIKRRSRGLCIDHLDGRPSSLDLADIHVSASYKGMELLRKQLADVPDLPAGIEVAHLCHHADPRLHLPAHQAPEFSARYFGNIANTVLPPECGVEAPSFDGSDGSFGTMTDAMMATPLHYGVRDTHRQIAKPFTKGFNAAACGANILVNRNLDDALIYLGEDYPYLVDDTSKAAIETGLQKAREEFGGPEWQRGLEIMRDVRERSSPKNIARQLEAILRRFD